MTVCEADLLVGHEAGLHARPAALFTQTAQRFRCEVTVAHNEQTANAKSILSILALGVSQGTTVRVRAQGPDAAEALQALSKLVADNFER
jgi:phosphocarrier protein